MLNLFTINKLIPGLKTADTFGLAIEATRIQLVKLKPVIHGFQLSNYAIEPLETKITSEGEIKNVAALIKGIKNCVLASTLRDTKVITAVPDTLTIHKIIQMDASLSVQEIHTHILLESDHYVPQPIEALNFDFQIIGPSAKSADEVDVLFVACHKKHIQERVEILEACGLTVQAVDIASHAIERVFQKLIEAENYSSTVALIYLGTDALTIAVQKNYQTIFLRTELLKTSSDLKNLSSQIQRHLQFFFSIHPNDNIRNIFLISQLDLTHDLLTDLNSVFNKDIKHIDYLPGILQPTTQSHLPKLPASDLWLSYGLALWPFVKK